MEPSAGSGPNSEPVPERTPPSVPLDAGSAPAMPAPASSLADAATVPGQVPDAAALANPDAATASDAAPPSAAGLVFSDSFEGNGTLDPARYEIVTPSCSGTGLISSDATDAHSGMRSLRVQGGGGYCNHVFFRPKALPAELPDPLYVRVFVKLEQALGAGHVTFVALHDAHEDKDLRLGGQNQVVIWNRESDDATLPELSPNGTALSVAPAAKSWHCVEWMIGSQTPGLSTWVDDAVVAGLVVDGQPTADVDRQWLRKTDWQAKPTDLRLGWESYGDQANTLWFDDLALGAARIGCGSR